MGLIAWLRRLISPAPARPHGASPFAPRMGPSRLVLLRHAEKTGDKSDPHLSPAGIKRAEQIVAYIPATFGPPQFLIAARSSNRSRRPVETLEPLAAALALDINSRLDDEECDELVRSLADKPRFRGKLGVISWRHSDLPRLIEALGAAPDLVPEPWPADDYTTIVDLAYSGDGTTVAKRSKMPF